MERLVAAGAAPLLGRHLNPMVRGGLGSRFSSPGCCWRGGGRVRHRHRHRLLDPPPLRIRTLGSATGGGCIDPGGGGGGGRGLVLSTGRPSPLRSASLSPKIPSTTFRWHLIPRSSSSSSPTSDLHHSPAAEDAIPVPRGSLVDDMFDGEDEEFQNLILEAEVLSNELDMTTPSGKTLSSSHARRILDSIASLHRLAATRKRARRVAALAERLLFRLMDEDERGGGGGRTGAAARPTTEAYNAVIDLWRLCRSTESGPRAQNVLDRVGELYAGDLEMQPDTSTFNAVIEAWARPPEEEGEGAPQSSQSPAFSALNVLNLMEELHAAGNIYVRPDGGSYSRVLLALAREAKRSSGSTTREEETATASRGSARTPSEAAAEAEGILMRMIELHRSGGGGGGGIAGASDQGDERVDLLPTPKCFGAVAFAWAKCGAPGRALDVVELMDGLGGEAVGSGGVGDGEAAWKLGIACPASIVNAFAYTGEAERAEEVLRRMKGGGGRRSVYVPPDSGIYNAVLHAWSIYPGDAGVAARRAEALLQEMEEIAGGEKGGPMHASDGDGGDDDVPKVGPTTFAYMTVIRLLGKCGDRDALERIFDTFDRMERVALSTPGDNPDVIVDAKTYTSVIDSLAKSGLPGSPEMAESVLTRMMDRKKGGDSALRPNASTFTAVISAWTRSREPGAAERAEDLLNRMMALYQRSGCAWAKPDAIAFGAVIDAWSKASRRGAADRAQRVLERMEELDRSGFDGVKPDARTFTSVIHAWAKSGEEVGAKRAEALLERMYSLYKAGDNTMMPDTIAFTSVINALSKSRDPGSARKALGLLERMEAMGRQVGQEGMKPNLITYKLVLRALSHSDDSDAPEMAALLLERMERMYDAGDSQVRPDTKSYNILINSYAKSKRKGKAECAWHVLVRMKERFEQEGNLDAMPDIFSYTSVINACAFSFDEEDRSTALGIAARAMEELQQCVSAEGPNSVTYSTLLKVYSNLVSDSAKRSELIESAFKKCCNDGQVNAAVLSNLQRVAPNLLMRLLPNNVHLENIDIGDLPADWSRNVRESLRSVPKKFRQ